MAANGDTNGDQTERLSSDGTTMPVMPATPTMPRISELSGAAGRPITELPSTAEMPAVGLPKSEVPASTDEPEVVAPARGGGLRTLLSMVAVAAVVVAVVFGLQAVGKWPSLTNPFGEKQTDRSQPVLLKSIQDLSRFVAAEGNFQVVIDMQQNRSYVPDFLFNERVLFVAAGTVEAYVDFSTIGNGAIETSDDRRTVRIKLPAPALATPPKIDNERSYVFAEQRGLVNRVGDFFGGDPNRIRQMYLLAEAKIGDAAKSSGLTERAQANTTKMLEGMLHSLGYETVNISYAAP
jgi:hypothetical protein